MSAYGCECVYACVNSDMCIGPSFALCAACDVKCVLCKRFLPVFQMLRYLE